MNLLFQTRKPRRFTHIPIYYSDREDRLRQLEQKAREELGQKGDGKSHLAFDEDIKGQFHRRRPAVGPLRMLLGSNMLLIAFVVLLLMLLVILTL